MSGGFFIDPAALRVTAAELDDAAQTLADQRRGLAVTPDAGASSGEVSGAFSALAAAATSIADALRERSAAVTVCADSYVDTDETVGSGFGGGR